MACSAVYTYGTLCQVKERCMEIKCKGCGTHIFREGGKARLFCNDLCRWKYHNEKRVVKAWNSAISSVLTISSLTDEQRTDIERMKR